MVIVIGTGTVIALAVVAINFSDDALDIWAGLFFLAGIVLLALMGIGAGVAIYNYWPSNPDAQLNIFADKLIAWFGYTIWFFAYLAIAWAIIRKFIKAKGGDKYKGIGFILLGVAVLIPYQVMDSVQISNQTVSNLAFTAWIICGLLPFCYGVRKVALSIGLVN